MSSKANNLDLAVFPLNGIRLIEASAGTGKTYSIAALYVRLVLGHGRTEQLPLMPPEILVLTFTRAATQELRDRIRSRLNEVAAAFQSGQAGDDDFVRELLADYQADQHKACARRLQLAAEWMDEAAIHTIHAWCQTMLRQHAFDSGSLFAQEVDSEDRELLDQVVKDYWRRHFYIRHDWTDELAELAASPEALSKTIRGLLRPGLIIQSGGQSIAGLPPGEALDQFSAWQQACETGLAPTRASWLQQRDEIIGLVTTAVAKKLLNRPYNKAGELELWFSELDAWASGARSKPASLEHFRVDAIARFLAAKAAGKAPHHDWFQQVAEALDALPAKPAATHAVWPHAVAWIRARYQEEKRRRNRLDFDDLLVQLDDALAGDRGEPLRQRILQTFPVALIDEFQDTDPVQYRIFERVYLPERDDPRHALVMIGDPKQSIYSFRGADIQTYLAARAQTSSEDRFTLPVNHRSSESMVQAVNRLFEAGDKYRCGAFGFRANDDDPVPFKPVEAKGRWEHLQVDGEPHASLTFWYQHADEKGKLSKAAHQPLMADLTAAQIVDLLNSSRHETPLTGFRGKDGALKPILPSDIAVLVNDRHDAARIQKALRVRGIGSVYLSDRDSVFDQPEAVDVLAILEAAAQALDDRRVRTALGVSSLRLSLTELNEISCDEARIEREIALFQRLGQIWRQQGVLAMLRRLLAEKSVPARLKEADSGWERQLTNLLHLAELLQAESSRRDSMQGLINWLSAEIARDNRSENDSEIIRLESDADLIRIVTVHKSKGLEYPLVFVPFASCYINPKNPQYLMFNDDQGQRVAELDGDNGDAVRRSRRAAIQERIRLLYVALTRARHACWIGVASIDGCPDTGISCLLSGAAGTDHSGGQSGLLSVLSRLAKESSQIALHGFTEADSQGEITRLELDQTELVWQPALEYPLRPRQRWWIASYSALRHGETALLAGGADVAGLSRIEKTFSESIEEDDQPPPGDRNPLPGTIHAFPKGATAGTLLHDLLEWAGNQGFAAVLADNATLEEQIRSRLARRSWEDWQTVLHHWLPRQLSLTMQLGDRSVRLVDLRPERQQYRSELAFLLAASSVPVAALDELVTAHTVAGRARPAFQPDTLQGMLTGFIDLVFEHEGRWYVADYKSNYLGPDAASYSQENMRQAILDKRYDLQYVFYTLALHRLLRQRLGQAYLPSDHLGGAAYLFLRGCDNEETGGVFFEPANIELIQTLDAVFAGQEHRHVA